MTDIDDILRKTIVLHSMQAAPIGSSKPPELTIVFDIDPPDGPDLVVAQRAYQTQGEEIVRMMGQSIPQGLMRAILVAMLQRETCVLRVAEQPVIDEGKPK